MGIEMQWYVPQKIVHGDIIGDISLEDIQNSSRELQEMFAQSDSPLVHVLSNESQVGSLPISLNMLSEAADFMRHPQMGWMITYGTDNRMAKFMLSMISGIARVRHRRFATLEESLEFLVSVDTTLPTIEQMLDR